MKTSLDLAVYGSWTADGRLKLWGFAGGKERLSAGELKLLLFAGDAESFYGAAVETWENGPLEGVLLDADEALGFFERPPVNPLASVTWHGGLDELRGSASALRRAFRAGALAPSFAGGATKELRWTVAGNFDPALSAALERSELLQRLAQGLMTAEARRNEALRAAIERLEHWNGPPPDERDWQYLTGWLHGNIPFLPALRLTEPADPERSPEWELKLVLIGGENGDGEITLVCDASGKPAEPAPEAWTPYLGHAEAALRLWLKAVPEIARSLEPPLIKDKLDDAEAWLFLTDFAGRLAARGGRVLLPSWWERLRAERPKLKMHVGIPESSGEPSIFGIDQMLRFDWKLSIGEVELSEEEFRALAASRRRLHHVRGQWIWLDDKLAGQLRVLAEKIRRRGGIPLKEVLRSYFGGPGEASDSLPETPQADWEIAAAPRLLRWMHELASQREIPPVRPPAAFRGSLRGYQAEGLAWLMRLRRHGFGACLADDMGLGKTIQYIAYLLKVREENPGAGPSLLICPTSLIGNWQKELARFSPDLRVHSHYGASRPKGGNRFAETVRGCDLVLTTYMTAFLDIDELCAARWNSLCLDEAQHIKNASAKQSAAIRKIPARHRIAMTGTPLENRLAELWSIFDFINPGYLGSLRDFSRRFAHAIEKEKDAGKIAQLKRLVGPFLKRREKRDPAIQLELPEKHEAKVFVSLTAEQGALYENCIRDMFEKLERATKMERRGIILAVLTKLKQLCDHPALFMNEGAAAQTVERSHKVRRLVEMAGELRAEGDRCLIFTQFVEAGHMLKRILEKELRERVQFLHGGTPRAERDEMVARFQNADIPDDEACGIFILSLKAGGIGLNLTAANHVFHFDRWWNPAVENQATDRAYRIGQQRRVQVHKFVTLGTLEEKIDEMIERKMSLTEQIIGGGESWLTELSTDELRELFALRSDWSEM